MEMVPWFIGVEGVQHSAEVARMLPYMVAGDRSGVVAPGDLKVQPLSTPGAGVRVMPGGAILKNVFPGGGQQAYMARNPQATNLTVAATGSNAGRTDLVVARIDDPQYQGQTPPDVNDYGYARLEVLQGRSSAAGLSYPVVELATIVIPANTATITAGMIRDRRDLAQGRTQRFIEMSHPSSTTDITGSSYHTVGAINVPVPEWATVAKVKADLSGVPVLRGWVSGQFNGVFPGQALEPTWVRGHAYSTSHAGSISGFTALQFAVPSAWQGTVQPFSFRVRRESDADNGLMRVDAGSTLSLDVTFEEAVR